MGELLEFLKYGAMGIAFALAGLSYRLLAREQDNAEVRKPILNTIKLYFLFSIFLSILFGSIELLTTLKKDSVPNDDLNYVHEKITGTVADISSAEKKNAIIQHLENLNKQNQAYYLTIDSIKRVDESFDFYHIIGELSGQVNRYGGINLYYNKHDKTQVFKLLDQLYIYIGLYNNSLEQDQELINQWTKLKSGWSNSGIDWIYHTDLGSIVTYYLRSQKNKLSQKQNE